MSVKEDLARAIELKTKVYGILAKALLKDRHAKHEIALTQIEEHKGRQGKAIRLLDDTLGMCRTHTVKAASTWQSARETKHYPINRFDTDSAQYGTAPTFIQTWQQFHDDIFDSVMRPKTQTVGYIHTNELSFENAIYVYWNQDEFDFASDKYGPMVYPKALCETRIKAVLRSIVEEHFNDDFGSKMERYLGLPAASLKREDTFDVKVRNFCARAAHFTDEKYYGPNGFMAEYEHYRNYYEALVADFHRISAIVKEHGGHAAIIKEMRCDTIRQLEEDAPLNISFEGDEHKPEVITDADLKTKWRTKEVSEFILEHADYFDYDILYATDTSITYIEDGSAMPRLRDKFGFEEHGPKTRHYWTSKDDESEIVNTFLQEREKCLTKEQSSDSPTI